MADDLRYRLQRPDPYAPDRTSRSSAAASKDDPLAELARLIGQDEAFLAATRQGARPRQADVGRDGDEGSAPNWLDRTTGRSRTPVSSDYHSETRLRERDYRSAQPDSESDHAGSDNEWPLTPSEDPYATAHEPESQWHEPRYDARGADKKPWFLAHTHEQESGIGGADDRYDPAHGQYDEERDEQLPAVDPFDSDRDDFHAVAEEDERTNAFRGRGGILTIAAVAALAFVGTAAAFGYRAWNSSTPAGEAPLIKADTAPTKVIPAQNGDGQSNKLIYDRIGEKIQQTSTDKIVSREEQPMDLGRQMPVRAVAPSAPSTVGTVSIGGQPAAYLPPTRPASSGTDFDQPKKVHTIPIRPDQTAMPPSPDMAPSPVRPLPSLAPNSRSNAAGNTAAKANVPKPGASGPMALNAAEEPAPPAARSSPAPSRPTQMAALPPAAAETGNYVVQLSSQRSESEAQASFRALQAKYANVLGSRHPLIRRADLGSKGVYYRAQVGPFASADEANQLCSELKTSGGQCIVQRN